MTERCLTCISIAAAVICGIGWLVRRVACPALIKYMLDKDIPLPSDAERRQAPISSKGGEAVKIRKFREAAGLTMKELAGKVGVSVPTVSRWENGEDLPAAG